MSCARPAIRAEPARRGPVMRMAVARARDAGAARLRQLGHCEAAIACPIDDPGFGKHPQAIAVGVAAGLLTEQAMRERQVG